MPLSWNETAPALLRFAEEWKTAHYEKGGDAKLFNEFLRWVAGGARTLPYEQKGQQAYKQYWFIDLFWLGQLLIEQKSAGITFTKARDCHRLFFNLKEQEKPWYILLSDFRILTFDLETREETSFCPFRSAQP